MRNLSTVAFRSPIALAGILTSLTVGLAACKAPVAANVDQSATSAAVEAPAIRLALHAYIDKTPGTRPVDLFIVRPPADWGVIFTIRTGPADWSQRLVTECQRWFMRVEGGRLLHHGRHVPCPEEADFLAAIGQPWLDP